MHEIQAFYFCENNMPGIKGFQLINTEKVPKSGIFFVKIDSLKVWLSNEKYNKSTKT